MGWLTGRRDLVAKDIQLNRQNVIQLPSGVNTNQAGTVQNDGSYANYAQNGYGRNELVYACIRYRAESLPQSVLRVYPRSTASGATPLDDHRLRLLFEKPNPVTNEFEFFELSSTYKDIAGTCYWLVVKGRDGLPSQLWPLRPDLVSVLPNPDDLADFDWIYRPDPEKPWLAVPVADAGSPRAKFADSFILRIRYPNPNPNDPGWRYFGQPPLRPAARATTLDNGATDFADSLLRNHAMPSVVVETESEINEVLQRRLSAKWREAFGGTRRGTPAFLQKGMKVHELGIKPVDLEFGDMRGITETRICMAFGVEPILIGAKEGLEHNAYKDYREARLSFWEEAMVSDQRRYVEPVRAFLLPLYGGVGRATVRCEWDNSQVLALKDAQKELWARGMDALARGGITRNDFRVMVGLNTVEGGDVFLNPAGTVPQEVGEPFVMPGQAGTPQQRPSDQNSPTAKAFLLAAEYGIELSPDELAQLNYRMEGLG